MKKVCLITLYIFLGTLIFCWCALVFIIPAIINTPKTQEFLSDLLRENCGINLSVKGLNLAVSPTLNTKLKIGSAKLETQNKTTGLELDNFSANADIKKVSVNSINADYINIDIDVLQKCLPKKKSSKKSRKNFNSNKIPNVNIKKIIITKNENIKLFAQSKDFTIKEINNQKDINLNVNLDMDRIKADVVTGQEGKFYVKDNKLFADNYSIAIGSAKFYLNGTVLNNNKLGDFQLEGDKIKVAETMKILVFLQRFTDPTKKFIENFKDFQGLGYLKVQYKNNELSGYAKLTEVKANTVLFNLPMYVKEGELFLKDNQITSFVTGIAGKEKITHKLLITNVLSKEREVFGEVNTKITEKMVKEYLPSTFNMQNYLNLKIEYYIKNRKVRVRYYADIPSHTQIIINHFYSGIKDKDKRIFAQTYKDGINLYLQEYKYSIKENNTYKDIISGDGFFLNEDGHVNPKYITCKTNGYVPNSFTGSFGRYVTGGKFNGSLKYDIPKEQITGNFEVIDTIFNDFFVKSAKVLADEKLIKVDANGTFKNQKFTCKGDAKNDFHGKIYVNNMDLFLDKYIIKKSSTPTKQNIDLSVPNKQLSNTVKKINMDIDKWKISGNTLKIQDKITVNNIELNGSMKNSVFKYNMPQLIFANGKISANGMYDFNKDVSVIDFCIKNINSNIIATKIFNLPNQIYGFANATLHSETGKNLSNWKATASFEIDQGALPQLSDMELFFIKKPHKNHKAKVSDFVKMKARKKGIIKSNIKGNFKCDDFSIYDIDLRLQHEFISVFAKGKYNYIKENETITLFGKYDHSISKKIKVLHIPLNWLINTLISRESTKNNYISDINKIPPIGIDNSKAKYFKIDITGNPKNKKTKVSVKIIK